MINSIWNYMAGSPGSPGRGKTRAATPVKPEYSLSFLQAQIDELVVGAGKVGSPKSGQSERLVETIRLVSETLLWGEQNAEDSAMFDYFAERGVMKIFVSLLNSGSARTVKIQLLQAISLLLLNVRRPTSLYFLFSNNAVNQLVNNTSNLDFSDEEILSYYISLLKSIALRVSPETIQFFIRAENPNYFPLFSQAVRFFDHHDRMVRIAVRTVTLSVFKLWPLSPALAEFLRENAGGYFSLLACQLRDVWVLIDKELTEGGASAVTRVGVIVDEMTDQLEYLADVDRLDLTELSVLMRTKLGLYAFPRFESGWNATSLFVLTQLGTFRADLLKKADPEYVKSVLRLPPNKPEFLLLVSLLRQMDADEEIQQLVAQSIGTSMSLRAAKIVCECLDLWAGDREVTLAIQAGFKRLTVSIVQRLGNGLLDVQERSESNEIDYSVIDVVEAALSEQTVVPQIDASVLFGEPSPLTLSDKLKSFLLVAEFVSKKPIDQEQLRKEWFEPQGDDLVPCIEAESLATDSLGEIPGNATEGDTVNLGKKDRVVCVHITAGRATRYLILDSRRLVLVSPDVTKPGFATIRSIEDLRKFSSISVSKEDDRILTIVPVRGEAITLGFDDSKRCHIALTHLESRRTEIRKQIFKRIESGLRLI